MDRYDEKGKRKPAERTVTAAVAKHKFTTKKQNLAYDSYDGASADAALNTVAPGKKGDQDDVYHLLYGARLGSNEGDFLQNHASFIIANYDKVYLARESCRALKDCVSVWRYDEDAVVEISTEVPNIYFVHPKGYLAPLSETPQSIRADTYVVELRNLSERATKQNAQMKVHTEDGDLQMYVAQFHYLFECQPKTGHCAGPCYSVPGLREDWSPWFMDGTLSFQSIEYGMNHLLHNKRVLAQCELALSSNLLKFGVQRVFDLVHGIPGFIRIQNKCVALGARV